MRCFWKNQGLKMERLPSYWENLHGRIRHGDVKSKRSCVQNVSRNSQKVRFARQIIAVNHCKVRDKDGSYGLER